MSRNKIALSKAEDILLTLAVILVLIAIIVTGYMWVTGLMCFTDPYGYCRAASYPAVIAYLIYIAGYGLALLCRCKPPIRELR